MSLAIDARRVLLLCGFCSAITVAAFARSDATANPASRFATMDALVEDGTFVIDHTVFDTCDKVMKDGHFYSSKPPLYSTIGAGFYWLLAHGFGLSFRGPHQALTIYLLNLILALGPHLLMLVSFARLVTLWTDKPEAQLLAFMGVALGQLGFGYATSLNNHTPTAAFLLTSFYYAYSLRRGHSRSRSHWWLAGLFAGLAPTIDFGALFVSSAIGLYLLSFDWRKTLQHFASAAIPPMALHFLLTYVVSGGLLPIYLRKELYLYPGSYWNAPMGMDALNESRPIYLFNMLFGHHGFFAMTPLLLLAVAALVGVLWRGSAKRAEALAVGVPLLVLVVFYTCTTKNYGGHCVGFRWLLAIVPLLFLFAAEWLSRDRGRLALGLFLALFAIGQVNALTTLTDPWQKESAWHKRCAWIGATLSP